MGFGFQIIGLFLLICVELHQLTFKLSQVWHQIFHKLKGKNKFFWHEHTIFIVCRIIAWPICNQYLNLFLKILMSTCAHVPKFGSSVSCKQSKFQQKIHSEWKMWMLNFELKYQQMQKILRYAYDSVLFITNTIFYLFRSCEFRAQLHTALHDCMFSRTHAWLLTKKQEILSKRPKNHEKEGKCINFDQKSSLRTMQSLALLKFDVKYA